MEVFHFFLGLLVFFIGLPAMAKDKLLGLFLIVLGAGNMAAALGFIDVGQEKKTTTPPPPPPAQISYTETTPTYDNVQTYIKEFICPYCDGSGVFTYNYQQYQCNYCVNGRIYFEDIDCQYCNDGIAGYGENAHFCDNCAEGLFAYCTYENFRDVYQNGKRAYKVGKYAYRVYSNREFIATSLNVAKRAARNKEWKKVSEEILRCIKRIK